MTQTLSPQSSTSAYVCEICQQDGTTCAHSLTPAPAAKISPVQKRMDFIAEVSKPVNDRALAILAAKAVGQEIPDLTQEEFVAVADAMAKGVDLGRTDRWKNACRWAINEITNRTASGEDVDASTARWAVVQASVWMCHAAD